MIWLYPPASHRGSYGFEVSPGVEFNFPMEQTTLSFGYIYSLQILREQADGQQR